MWRELVSGSSSSGTCAPFLSGYSVVVAVAGDNGEVRACACAMLGPGLGTLPGRGSPACTQQPAPHGSVLWGPTLIHLAAS